MITNDIAHYFLMHLMITLRLQSNVNKTATLHLFSGGTVYLAAVGGLWEDSGQGCGGRGSGKGFWKVIGHLSREEAWQKLSG